MIPALLAASTTGVSVMAGETVDSTTMTHGESGGKVNETGFSAILFGSLADANFRSATILKVSTGVTGLVVVLSGNRAQDYFDRVECVLGTYDHSAATWSYDSTPDETTWTWSSLYFAATGSSTVDFIY